MPEGEIDFMAKAVHQMSLESGLDDEKYHKDSIKLDPTRTDPIRNNRPKNIEI